MTLKSAEAPRCSSGERCVSYPALGEPARLSRGNPGPRCFACEERRAASGLKLAAARKVVAVEGGKGRGEGLEEHAGREHDEQRLHEVLERRRRSVLTCERGLRSALASGDERLVRRWARSLRDAEARLVWAEADLRAAETRARSA